jgi:curli biogenesis system outer membrane secretion channel CsgG
MQVRTTISLGLIAAIGGFPVAGHPLAELLPAVEAPASTLQGQRPAVQEWTGIKKRLAVVDLELKVSATTTTDPTSGGGMSTTQTINIPPPTDFGTGMTEMLTTSLVESNRFVVLERKAMDDILAEQRREGIDPEQGIQPQKLLGAQYLVRGAITEFTFRRSSVGGTGVLGRQLGVSSAKTEAMVALDIRIYDTTTGQILDSVRGEGRAQASATAANVEYKDLKFGGSGFNESPLGKATREAITKAVTEIIKRLETRPWEGRVADVDADEDGKEVDVYINGGAEIGVKAGEILEILRPGEPILDPETKMLIGRRRDRKIGMIRIDTVHKSLSIGRLVEGTAPEKNDVVRYPVKAG